jgi:hypothetical protein
MGPGSSLVSGDWLVGLDASMYRLRGRVCPLNTLLGPPNKISEFLSLASPGHRL